MKRSLWRKAEQSSGIEFDERGVGSAPFSKRNRLATLLGLEGPSLLRLPFIGPYVHLKLLHKDPEGQRCNPETIPTAVSCDVGRHKCNVNGTVDDRNPA